jgi:hypothetical protein
MHTSKRLLAIAAGITLFWTTVSFVVIVNARSAIMPIMVDIPDFAMPGNDLPPRAACDRRMASEEIMYCSFYYHEKLIYLTYDTVKRQIVTTVTSLGSQQPIGNLLLDWGTPTGIMRWGIATKVFWGNKSVYLVARPFAPESKGRFISFTLEKRDTMTWAGFMNKKRE